MDSIVHIPFQLENLDAPIHLLSRSGQTIAGQPASHLPK
jgi:hypothetical protein